jgi:SPP1 gp7 family putative phage head morphogenesis protein
MKYPIGIEYSYRRQLLWLNNQHRKALKKYLFPILGSITEEAGSINDLPTGQIIRQDAGWQDDLYDAFRKIAEAMVRPKQETIRNMARVAPQINEYNKDQWKQLVRSQYGVNPTREDPGTYIPLMKTWAQNNALLIDDIPAKTAKQIQDLTIDTLLSGKTQQEMIDEIQDIMGERMDVSDSRAKLIARDQVAKLNGQFTRERQTEAGVDSYVWRTVGDERVRETHEMADGNTYSWSSPPEETDGNHPGEDYQCRCWAEPILPESLDVSAELLTEELEDA